MKKLETLKKILQLSEFVKLEVKNHDSCHHPLKSDLGKSHNRILWLLERKGPLNQRKISKLLNISPQAISEAVKKLEIGKFITKDNTNKNESVISLTQSGLQQALSFKEVVSIHANELLKEFNEEELQQFINLITKLLPKEDCND